MLTPWRYPKGHRNRINGPPAHGRLLDGALASLSRSRSVASSTVAQAPESRNRTCKRSAFRTDRAVRKGPLSGAPASCSRIPHSAREEHPLHRVQMWQQSGNLGQERVGKQGSDLLVAAAAGIPHQVAHVHLEGCSQPLKRTERGYGLAVFDLGDIGAGHLHAPGQLALAHVARLANIAHLPSNLQPGLGGSRSGWADHQLRRQRHRLFHIEGPVALSAKGVAGPELHQAAVIAAQYFARFYTHEGDSHWLCAECQSGNSGVHFRTAIWVTFGEVNHNCQVET